MKVKYMNQKFYLIEQFNLFINLQKYFEMVNKVQDRLRVMEIEQKSVWNLLKNGKSKSY